MVVDGVCVSCKAGSGNPGCKVRVCAKEKGIEVCALCENHPCELFTISLKDPQFLNTTILFFERKVWMNGQNFKTNDRSEDLLIRRVAMNRQGWYTEKMPACNKGFGKMGGVTFNKQEWLIMNCSAFNKQYQPPTSPSPWPLSASGGQRVRKNKQRQDL